MFPSTPKTLIARITQLAPDDDAAEWESFVELYTPALRTFVHQIQGNVSETDIDDVVQDVFVRVVDVLRDGKFDRSKGKFRAYLAAMTRRILIDRYRAELVRLHSPFPIPYSPPELGTVPDGGVAAIDPGVAADIHWRQAVRAAAKQHVLTKTAVSERSKRIYLELDGGLSPREVAAKLQVSRDVVKQVKSRIDRAISALEQRFAE